MATAIVPKIYDPTLADEDIGIRPKTAYKMAKRLAREEGLAGGDFGRGSGRGLPESRERAQEGQPAVIVTILCDSGDKYLSERFWTEAQ